jgi:hypothetical protein
MQYTESEASIAARLLADADSSCTVPAATMKDLAHERPELHETLPIAAAFRALTGKDWDAELANA